MSYESDLKHFLKMKLREQCHKCPLWDEPCLDLDKILDKYQTEKSLRTFLQTRSRGFYYKISYKNLKKLTNTMIDIYEPFVYYSYDLLPAQPCGYLFEKDGVVLVEALERLRTIFEAELNYLLKVRKNNEKK